MMRNGGFTLLEIIIAIVVAAIVIIPVAVMLLEYARSTVYAETLAQTMNLTQLEMAVINNEEYANLGVGSQTAQNYAGSNFDLQRVVSYVAGTSNRLKLVLVKLFPHLSSSGFGETATYEIGMNVGFGPGTSGKGISDPEASFFTSGPAGSILKDRVQYIPLANTRAKYNITMVAVEMSSVPNKILHWVATKERWKWWYLYSKEVVLNEDPQTIHFYKNFFMPGKSTYNLHHGAQFIFKDTGDGPYTITVRYVFIDGSKSDFMTYSYLP